jgi:hypothetical protein
MEGVIEAMKDYLCVYLDILGFKNFLERDLQGAAGLLQDYNDVLRNGEYGFENFIAGSDSIFILASDPANCISELASFVMECFEYNSRAFSDPNDKNDPSIVQMAVPRMKGGRAVIEHEKVNWFPLLFRGGVSYGQATLFHPPSRISGSMASSTSVFGTGVVNAVLLEQRGYAGPMIAIDLAGFNKIPPDERRYIRKLDDDTGLYELLWPLSKWPIGNDISILRNDIAIALGSVMNLYKAYGAEKSGKHYKSLFMLYIRSAYRALTSASSENTAKEMLLEMPGVTASLFKWPN